MFSIGTTSFILWDSWAQNISYLKDKVDYIQLLFLEDLPEDCLPTAAEIVHLAEFKKRHNNLHFSAHLPHRIQLAALDKHTRERSVDRLKRVLDLVDSIGIDYYVLHPYIYDRNGEELLKQSIENMRASLTALFVDYPFPRKIGLETLHFDFHHLKDVVYDLDTSVIVDIGQSVRYKKDYFSYLTTYFDRVVDVHLHGFDGKKDHESLRHMSDFDILRLLEFLLARGYKQNVLLEVFSEHNFTESINLLKKLLWQIQK